MLATGVVRTHPHLAILVVVLALTNSLLPAAFSLATGLLVGSLPAAIAGGTAAESAAHRASLAVWLLGSVFVLRQIAGPLQSVASDALGRRYMATIYRRVMRAALAPATILHVEDNALHNMVRKSLAEGWAGPRAATNGLIGWASHRLHGLVALAVLAHFSLPLAVLLGAAHLFYLRKMLAAHDELLRVRFLRTETMRFADHLAGSLTAAHTAKEVRIFGLRGWLADRFEETWLGEMATIWSRRRDMVPLTAVAMAPAVVVEAATLWLAGSAAMSGAIDLGALLVYATSTQQSHSLSELGDNELMMEYGTASFGALREMERALQTDPRLVLPGSRPADGLPRESIRIKNVSFRYSGRDEDVFHNLSLEIPVGRSLAIVGANGAGKTTLIKLLARLYDPTAGQILVDGADLREFDPRSWQRRVAAIFQDYQRFDLPAYDNIALGAVERQAAREKVVEAARRAGALQLIEDLPLGWQTILSKQYTGGTDLSGGQWQRIALARALFAASCGASILIMDEPTAQLDVRAEAAFYESFLDLTEGLTTIVISHRFSTVRRADRIVVLERDGVVEDGSHAELMQLGGKYAHMFALQAQRFVETAAPA